MVSTMLRNLNLIVPNIGHTPSRVIGSNKGKAWPEENPETPGEHAEPFIKKKDQLPQTFEPLNHYVVHWL